MLQTGNTILSCVICRYVIEVTFLLHVIYIISVPSTFYLSEKKDVLHIQCSAKVIGPGPVLY